MAIVPESVSMPAQTYSLPKHTLISMGKQMLRMRDLVYDVLQNARLMREWDGFTQSGGIAPEIWDSLERDEGPFMMVLDFLRVQGGIKLVRTAGPWATLRQGLIVDEYLPIYLAHYLVRRVHGEEEARRKARIHPDVGSRGRIAIRLPDYEDIAYGDDPAMRRAAHLENFETETAGIEAGWDSGLTYDAAWIQAPYVGSLSGMFDLPPPSVPLVMPLWTSLLDEPALMAHLYKINPHDECLLPARIDLQGRSLGQQTGIDLNNEHFVTQDLGGIDPDQPIQLLRCFIDDSRILGLSVLHDANLRCAESGIVIALQPNDQK